jgi:ribosomal protein L37E
VTPLDPPSWSRFFEEFHCRGCGFQEAYRSRPRTFFEKHVLRFFLLQAVRCERCYHRSYVLRTISVLEREQPHRKQSQSQPPGDSASNSRVA